MWLTKLHVWMIVSALLSLFLCAEAMAQTTVIERHVIVTPAPKYESCTTVAGHWEGDVWVNEQTVCKYSDRKEGVAWVQDYWACTQFTDNGDCTAWEYRPGHWVSTVP